ncbi:hypothetical protein [Marinobacter sp. X15-166B]|uniref:hypothetical protein n=1 Tax=Marinobacter sp. X15-166B TaxID=1897620 RepID=UPI00085C966D|nr:hypothetical protein [Marinobacter sp. X15-166B]OEY66787.1 hypothetical protein BG841_10200 [Marinobacter sp. X15-166B]
MNKSKLFKNAHKVAKATVAIVGDYMIAFSLALKAAYSELKNNMQQKLESLGLSVWGADFGKARIYVNIESLAAVFGLDIDFYGTGNISIAHLNGKKISNSAARRLIEDKIYFDIARNEFVGTELTPII